ncbi:MAG: hypothetical protein ACR2G7_12205 [Acidimicrobiales bacterium]
MGRPPGSVDELAPPAVVAPGALVACAALGLGAVLLLPEVAPVLPWGDRPEPNEVQLAVTSLGVLVVTALYLTAAQRTIGLSRSWLALAFAYNALIVVVKFILSPASFHNSPETTLAEHLWAGIVAMVLYVVALTAVYAVARRNQHPRRWAWPSKLGLVLALLVLALVSRYVTAVALGRAASEYLRDVFVSAGPWLPLLIVAASFLAVEAFDRAAHPVGPARPGATLRSSFGIGLGLVVAYHALWVVFMLRLY